MAFDGLVALASPGFDLRNIQELNVAPAVFDETGLLESPGNKRYAAATDPEHLRKESWVSCISSRPQERHALAHSTN